MKDSIGVKRVMAKAIIPMFLWFCVLLYNQMPGYRVHVIDKPSQAVHKPVVVYSQRSIQEIKKECICWMGCLCIQEHVNKILEACAVRGSFVDVLVHSPGDLKFILEHKITCSPHVFPDGIRPRSSGSSKYALYTLAEHINIFQYFADGLMYSLFEFCTNFSKERKDTYIQGLIVLLYVLATSRRMRCLSAQNKERRPKNELEIH
ncbi:hypothetical protein NEIRO03_0468 [Nematocida sp. AWRm78]|nr:hypothetical protein NEIRO02_0473 [Nematocida sp. AWRm79]KAI5182826.1 hypothetical protein NEIRO03_0468 [Nematocida sp. AWRm78]